MRRVGAVLLENLYQLIYRRSFFLLLEAESDSVLKHEGITLWNAVIYATLHLFEELVHTLAPEWGLEAAKLIHDAAKGPHITVESVCLVIPYLRTRVIRRSCLSVRQAIDQLLRDIQIPDLQLILTAEEDIGGLEISMDDVH